MTNILEQTSRRPDPEESEGPGSTHEETVAQRGAVTWLHSKGGTRKQVSNFPAERLPLAGSFCQESHSLQSPPQDRIKPQEVSYPGSRLRAGRPSAGTSQPGAGVAADAGSPRAASPHSLSPLAPAPAMRWRCPVGQAEVPSIMAHPLLRRGHRSQGHPENTGTGSPRPACPRRA